MATPSTAWADPLKSIDATPLTGDLSCDACIVGAGIAGLTVAYQLAENGRDVVVLDLGDSPGGGETRFTTAHLATALDDRYFEIARIRGVDAAKLVHDSHAAAIDRIEAIVDAERIECGFRRLDGHLFAAPGDKAVIDKEHAAAQAAGCDVELMARPPVASLGDVPCLLFRRQAAFEPGKYLAGLWAAAQRRGVRFFGSTRVTDVSGGDRPVAKTDRGFHVSASAIVVATNTPTHTRVALHTKLAAYTTYALAAAVPRGSVPDALYWDTLDPYHYIRLSGTRERNGEELLIVGGNDHRTGQHDKPEECWNDLERWARTRFPGMGTVAHRWSGMVMETLDGLAYIGRDPSGERNVYLVAGDSGMGLTHGSIAGLLLPELIGGRPHPWEELYRPGRTPVKSAGDFISENVHTAMPYVDWLTGGDVPSVADVKPGDGAVIRSGLTKRAVSRDADGTLHMCSAVCPHLGALVRWNSAEKTWDCPAHGSRFDAAGKVFHGPAHDNLSTKEPGESA